MRICNAHGRAPYLLPPRWERGRYVPPPAIQVDVYCSLPARHEGPHRSLTKVVWPNEAALQDRTPRWGREPRP